MSTIITRSGKGSPLTNAELDANFTNLNTDKLEAGALSPYLLSATAASTYLPLSGGTLTGNLTLSGTGRRITGDFSSNSPITDRIMVQTSTANANTLFSVLPSGTSTTSRYIAFNNSDPTNSGAIQVSALSTDVRIQSFVNGTGTAVPLYLMMQGTEVATISTGSNFLIGSIIDDGSNKLQVTGNTALTGNLTLSGSATLSGGTANQVQFLNGSKALSGSANLTWDGTTFAITGALTASTDSSFTSTGAVLISKGTTAQQPASPVVGMIRYNTSTSQFEGYSGSSPAWKSIGGSALSNDTSTASTLYPVFAGATTGTAENLYTSNAKLLYKPSTGELSASVPRASNGIFINAANVSTSYTIASGDNGVSAGTITVDNGVTVTVSNGSRWVVV